MSVGVKFSHNQRADFVVGYHEAAAKTLALNAVSTKLHPSTPWRFSRDFAFLFRV